jgi:6-pyruvoyltetrahydropterin/6-carboxytetrahydropterin synthase
VTTVRLTRVVEFHAAHRYFRPDWPAERNAAVFGACAGEHGHGHMYRCFVTVAGPVAPDTSMVIDLATFDRILEDEVTARFNHRHINYDVPEFAFGKTIPTVEALAMDIGRRVAARLPAGVTLSRVRVQEEPDLYADFDGHDA